MEKQKTKLELEYELELTKRTLERILELNKDKDLIMPDDSELDRIEDQLRRELERQYPKYKIQKK